MTADIILLVILAAIVVVVGGTLATFWAIAYVARCVDDGSDEYGA